MLGLWSGGADVCTNARGFSLLEAQAKLDVWMSNEGTVSTFRYRHYFLQSVAGGKHEAFDLLARTSVELSRSLQRVQKVCRGTLDSPEKFKKVHWSFDKTFKQIVKLLKIRNYILCD